jgi:hypothetical protein
MHILLDKVDDLSDVGMCAHGSRIELVTQVWLFVHMIEDMFEKILV